MSGINPKPPPHLGTLAGGHGSDLIKKYVGAFLYWEADLMGRAGIQINAERVPSIGIRSDMKGMTEFCAPLFTYML
jgi:hypothetical protein